VADRIAEFFHLHTVEHRFRPEPPTTFRVPEDATEDLKASIMDKLLALPPSIPVHPGHTDPTTVGDELESNAFVRIWRGLDAEGSEPCTALGEPATLVLLGDDYDGGHKAWVRWPDGSDDIVPGSKVESG
jgi:glyoxylase-like metal-dependent hydrolase (beta-lactamase superfamily II)